MNPFIEFARNPVTTLTWLGYGLVLLAIGVAALRTVLRGLPKLYVQYMNNRHTDDWWAFGDRRTGYLPPLGWSVKLVVYILVLAIAMWAAGALLWVIG